MQRSCPVHARRLFLSTARAVPFWLATCPWTPVLARAWRALAGFQQESCIVLLHVLLFRAPHRLTFSRSQLSIPTSSLGRGSSRRRKPGFVRDEDKYRNGHEYTALFAILVSWKVYGTWMVSYNTTPKSGSPYDMTLIRIGHHKRGCSHRLSTNQSDWPRSQGLQHQVTTHLLLLEHFLKILFCMIAHLRRAPVDRLYGLFRRKREVRVLSQSLSPIHLHLHTHARAHFQAGERVRTATRFHLRSEIDVTNLKMSSPMRTTTYPFPQDVQQLGWHVSFCSLASHICIIRKFQASM